MTPAERDLRNELRAALVAAKRIAPSLEFDATDEQELYPCVLYGRVMDLARDFMRIHASSAISAGQIVLRSLLEAFVDLRNVSEDPGYTKNMQAKDIDEWLKIFREAGKKQNPYLASISELDELV